MKIQRQIIFHGNYFQDFYIEADDALREKIGYVFHLIRTVNHIPEKFLKHLEGTEGLYEIRVELSNNIFRIICFFDKGNLVVLLNAFQKKTQKTPKNEIVLAEKLRNEYFAQKKIKK